MVSESVFGFKALYRVLVHLQAHVSKKLPVSCTRAYLYVVLAGKPCACRDILQHCDITHDDLNRLLKSYKRSERTGTLEGYDLLVINTHPGNLRQNEASLSVRGQQIRDALGDLLKGPRPQIE